MFLRSFLFHHLPAPGPLFDRFGQLGVINDYLIWWSYSRDALAKWHRERLKEVDKDFVFSEKIDQLMQARREARAKGIGPGDPRYPDLWDTSGDEPPIPLAHRTAKLQARDELV